MGGKTWPVDFSVSRGLALRKATGNDSVELPDKTGCLVNLDFAEEQ